MPIRNTLIEVDRGAIEFVYDNFARHLQTGQQPPKHRKEAGDCEITGLPDVPVVMVGGIWRWEKLHALFGATDLLGRKSSGTPKRLGDRGAPRVFLVRDNAATLWLHEIEFRSPKDGPRRWQPASAEHGLFAVRRYSDLDKLMVKLILDASDRPFVVCRGVPGDPYEAAASITLNRDPDIVQVSGEEQAYYRIPILKALVEAATGLPARIGNNGRRLFDNANLLHAVLDKSEAVGGPGIVELVALVHHARIRLDQASESVCKTIESSGTKNAELLQFLSMSPYAAEFELLFKLALKHAPGETFSLGETHAHV